MMYITSQGLLLSFIKAPTLEQTKDGQNDDNPL